MGFRADGVFTVNVMGTPVLVYCEFQLDGHNWIVSLLIPSHARKNCQTCRVFDRCKSRRSSMKKCRLKDLKVEMRKGICALILFQLFLKGNTWCHQWNLSKNLKMEIIVQQFVQMFQRRTNGTIDFYMNWRTYQVGFGRPDQEHWMGEWLI